MQTISTALRNAIDAGNPQRVLLVFGNDEFSNEDILMTKGIELSEEFNSEQELTIGTTPSSILTFTMLNDSGQLANFNFGWFTAYLGARIDSGTPTEITRTFTENGETVTYAFSKLGIFYASKPDIVVKKTINVTAYDQMLRLEADMPSSTSLGISYPTTLGSFYDTLCYQIGIPYTASPFFNSTLEIAKEPPDLSMATIRQVIGWIAECACSIARFNRDGALEFAWFNTTSKTYDESGYKEFTPAWYETQAINGMYYRNTNESKQDTTGVTLTNNYLIQDNPFLNG